MLKAGKQGKKLRQEDKCTRQHDGGLQLYYNTNVCLLRRNKQTNQPCLPFNPVGDNHTQTTRKKRGRDPTANNAPLQSLNLFN